MLQLCKVHQRWIPDKKIQKMVLEELFFNETKQPVRLFFLGLLYSSLSVLISVFFFQNQAPTFFLFFTVLFCVPLVYKIISTEEKKEEAIMHEKTRLIEHVKTTDFFLYLFAGMVLGYLAWFVILPINLSEIVFEEQIKEITQINTQSITGNIISNIKATNEIFIHNSGIIALCLFFSLLFGAGAIFIIVWNAAIISAAIGLLIRNGSFLEITRFFIHGIPEIAAYFIALLAGGILSITILHNHFSTPSRYVLLYDIVCLILLSFGILYFAAFLEVYVSSLL